MKSGFVIFCLSLLISINCWSQEVWLCKDATISFFSEAPLEDITATSHKGISAINTKTMKVSTKVRISSMAFDNQLQKEHFNEKYMESELYPFATFSGDIVGKVDFKTKGMYPVQVKGQLDIHGVVQERTIDAEITVTDKGIEAKASFDVKIEDHKVEVPELVFNKVAEVVAISIEAIYQAYKSK